MAWSFVSSVGAKSPDSNGFTTGSVDTSGANFLFAVVTDVEGATATLSDSKGNTWTALTPNGAGTTNNSCFYCESATVGSGHTFTISGAATYGSVEVLAFSGGATSSSLDAQTGTFNNSNPNTLAPGSVTPSEDDCLVVTGLSLRDYAGTLSIDGGFTKDTAEQTFSGNAIGTAAAYLIQTSAAAANPTWTIGSSGTTYAATTIAAFKASAAGGETLMGAQCL
jgi:hypothetical protein